MRVALISLSTPTYNNVRAASALPYHLIWGSKGNRFKIYSFDINHVEEEERKKTENKLNTEIELLSRPIWITWMFKLRLTILRVFLRHPFFCYYHLNSFFINEIKEWQPDIIWIYGEELAGLAKHFVGTNTIVTMPDCESMYYYRLFSKRFATKNFFQIIRYAIAYYQYRRMEIDLWRKEVNYHFVGKADSDFFKEINPKAHVQFLPHPVYGFTKERKIQFHQPNIKILVAGRYDIYMKEACDDAFQVFLDNQKFSNHYEITFLGKGWEKSCNLLKLNGYNCNHISFAPNYIEELIKHDIQLTPISIGTGTKGKVLDALANGLMVIGTLFALENIQVEDGKSCIFYNSPDELKHYLEHIPSHIEEYEKIAERGRESVLKYHDKKRIASKLFV